MSDDEWTWTPELYAGTATFYVRGRVAYPRELADRLAAKLAQTTFGRLLDVGCGPGTLTLPLAERFVQAIGLDADADMLVEAAHQAAAARITNVIWVHMKAEDLPGDLGAFDVITLAQSFHWMDREVVARALRGMLNAEGALVHVGATTHQGVDSDAPPIHPRPPRGAIEDLVTRYLEDQWRAGRGVPRRRTGGDEDAIFRSVGFRGPTIVEVPGRSVVRTVDDIVAGVFSLSSSTPVLFGARRDAFESELRGLLRATSPSGLFSEQMREITLTIWRL